ncbi:MAG: hypothetical protein GH148_06595 [Clostridia bacterium]|nr:hypothetical protein [Clostridia bacterium]
MQAGGKELKPPTYFLARERIKEQNPCFSSKGGEYQQARIATSPGPTDKSTRTD